METIFKWIIYKLEVESAFLQTTHVERDVSAHPPPKSDHNNIKFWILSAATYVIFNASSKWKIKYDQLLLDLGMSRTPLIILLFYRNTNGNQSVLCGKIFDDLLLAGQPADLNDLIKGFNRKFSIGKIVHGHGHLSFFWLNIFEKYDQ